MISCFCRAERVFEPDQNLLSLFLIMHICKCLLFTRITTTSALILQDPPQSLSSATFPGMMMMDKAELVVVGGTRAARVGVTFTTSQTVNRAARTHDNRPAARRSTRPHVVPEAGVFQGRTVEDGFMLNLHKSVFTRSNCASLF